MEDSKVSKITEQANDSQHIDFDCQDAMPLYDFFVNIGKRVVSFVEASEKSFNLLHQYGIPFFSFLNQLGQQLIDALSNLDIPTDEERLQLIERSIKWGSVGGHLFPQCPWTCSKTFLIQQKKPTSLLFNTALMKKSRNSLPAWKNRTLIKAICNLQFSVIEINSTRLVLYLCVA